MSWAATLGGILLEAVLVRGAGTCPSPSDVEARLAPLVRSSARPPDVAQVFRRDAVVTVALARADGRSIGRQTLEGTSCSDLAEAAAVILATWENDDTPGSGLSWPLPPSSERRSPASPPDPMPKSSRERSWDVALGAGASLAPRAFSLALMGSGSFAPG